MKFLHETPWYGYAIVAVAVAVGMLLALTFYTQGAKSDRNQTALIALCAQRSDLDAQIRATETLLHPKTRRQRRDARVVFRAIPRSLIVDGQRRNRETRRNLAILDC